MLGAAGVAVAGVAAGAGVAPLDVAGLAVVAAPLTAGVAGAAFAACLGMAIICIIPKSPVTLRPTTKLIVRGCRTFSLPFW